MPAAVIETLFAPLRDGTLALPRGRTLFLRAEATPALALFGDALVCTQSFKPHADALAALGHAPVDDLDDEVFDLVLVLPSRQRDETRAALVEALQRVSERGHVLTAAANDAGARSLQRDAARLFGNVRSAAMNKCRAVWSLGLERDASSGLAQMWTDAMAPVQVPGTTLFATPGLFSWDAVDGGSALLAAHLPADLAGCGADLGAGWGYLADRVLRHCAGVRALHLYEADRVALARARANLQPLRAGLPHELEIEGFWHDVTRGVPQAYDFVVCNPPFHVDRAGQPELGLQFIRAAAAALRPGGRLWLVANRHLPYEDELRARFVHVDKRADANGFKVFEAIRGER